MESENSKNKKVTKTMSNQQPHPSHTQEIRFNVQELSHLQSK